MALGSEGRKRKVLVVDSSSSVRTSLWMILKDEYVVLTVSDLSEALEVVGREGVEIVLVGVDLPLFFYESFFRALRQVQPRLPVLLLMGEGVVPEKGFVLPFSDGLSKPFGVESLREKVRVLLLQRDWVEKGRGVRRVLPGEERVRSWFYSSRVPVGVRERVLKVAGCSLPVFIQGEEGTGRSGVARAVHLLGSWRGRPFLRFFCRDLTVEGFMERLSFWLSEVGIGEGVCGTFFFEEVESLGWDMQGVVLDLLHGGGLGWWGGEGVGEVRVISSSKYSLSGAVGVGRFRGDLYEGLEVLRVVLPPLRERREEIPRMVREVLGEQGLGVWERKKFSLEAMRVLQEYYWPGNVRELEGVVLRSAALKEGDMVMPEDLVFSFSGGKVGVSLGEEKQVGEGVLPLSSPVVEEGKTFFDATLATLAHEIKNPLVAISTFAYLLPEKYEDAEFREQFSRLVSLDVKRINKLLESLLEYMQFSVPRLVGNDLNFRLGEVVKEKEKELVQWGVRWVMELGEGLPAVLFDEVQLGFVLRSVLENVFLRGGEGKLLRLSTGMVGMGEEGRTGYVELRVGYDGEDGVLGVRREGNGEAGLEYENWSLALALARRVMVGNRGKMQVSLGKGARTAVRLRFPVAISAERRTIKESHA